MSASAIHGVVRDESGAGAAGVGVLALSTDGLAFARSTADGSFTIDVNGHGPFLVDLETGEPSSEDHATAWVAPGARDVVLVLRNAIRATILVVDDASGQPVEHFGLRVANDASTGIHGGNDMVDVPVDEHPRGEAIAWVRREKNVLRVQAPGYASAEVAVLPQITTTPRQTIRLVRGGAIAGRATASGKPAAGADVVAVRGPLGTVWPELDEKPEPDAWFLAEYPRDLGDYAGRPRQAKTAEDGAFTIADLDPGTYDVVVGGPAFAPVLVKRIRVVRGETARVSDVALGPPAVLRGQVTTAPGVPIDALEWIVDGDFRARQKLSQDGTFVREGLGVGVHRVELTGPRSVLPMPQRKDVRLRAGATTDVVFDLGQAGPCRVTARVLHGGKPFDARYVEAWVDTASDKGSSGLLSRTGQLGVFEGDVLGSAPVRFRVVGRNGLRIATARFDALGPGWKRDLDLSVSPGSLVVVLPDGFVLPEIGAITVDLTRGGERQRTVAGTPELAVRYGATEWTGRRFEVGWLEPGEYEVVVRAGPGRSDALDVERDLLFAPPRRLVVKEDETTEFVLGR